MKRMNPRVKKLWVAALRSGQYRQGRHQLRTGNNCFCVLGVLCNLHARAHPEIAAAQKDRTGYMGLYRSLSTAVEVWSGFYPTVMRLRWKPAGEPLQKITLTLLNDLYELPFEQLADLIEKQL